jgi:hypothetical protein
MAEKSLLDAAPAELIDLALQVLRGKLQAALTEESERAAAQAALRALSVAKADLTADPAIVARELAEIEALLGPADAAAAVRLRDHLLNATAHRLRLTNPKYMTRRQRRAESSY